MSPTDGNLTSFENEELYPIPSLFHYVATQLRGLEESLSLIADAAEESQLVAPNREKLKAAVSTLNHLGLHVPDYRVLALVMGVEYV